MFMEADIVVKCVILMLVAASFWSWSIIFDKLYKFFVFHKRMEKFEHSIWSGTSLEERFNRIKDHPDHPLATVFVSGMYEWLDVKQRSRLSDVQRAFLPSASALTRQEDDYHQGIKAQVLHVMDLARNREIASMEHNLSFLATVGSSAPFIGLFGTVWGIMDSFQAIAMTKNTTLAVVAPGIAEALFATAVGLFAAIPSVIFYNKFANEVAVFSDRMDDFVDEFITMLGQELHCGNSSESQPAPSPAVVSS